MKDLTIASIRNLLQPQTIVEKYQASAPFTWAVLEEFSASPNKWHQRAARKGTAATEEEEGSDWDDDPNLDDEGSRNLQWQNTTPEGFTRNPIFVSTLLRTHYDS